MLVSPAPSTCNSSNRSGSNSPRSILSLERKRAGSYPSQQPRWEASALTSTLTLMICPRPGCSRGSGCSAPAHTPVQLIITSAPPLATCHQPAGQVGQKGVRTLVSTAPLPSRFKALSSQGTAGRRLSEEFLDLAPNVSSAIYLSCGLRNVTSPPQGSAALAIKWGR